MSNVKTSSAEPVTQLRRVRIVESGEELVDFLACCPGLLLDEPRFQYRRETLLRRTVAEMLCRAEQALPAGVRLAVIEGWRAPHIQRRMYRAIWNRIAEENPTWSEVTLKRVVNRFSAPMNLKVPPPHTTGGAVDVMLADTAGNLLDHSSPYESYDFDAAPLNAAGLSETASRTRQVLSTVLRGAGFTNYPSEYWHWSYGDQGWAYRGNHPHAVYGATTPPHWTPDPNDDIDTPLEFLAA